MKLGIEEHLIGAWKSKLVVIKGIIYMLTFSSSIINGRVIAKVLGVDKWNI